MLNWGHYAVCVFIALSGYCLMLPVARDPSHRLKGGVAGYLRRRARRVLTAYYRALVFTILAMWLCSVLSTQTPQPWPSRIPWQEVPTRLLLVHNLVKDHWKLNPPMWNVALEWQVDFLMPAILLTAWRRFGDAVLVPVSGAIAATPVLLLPRGNNLWRAQTQMVSLFAIGMIAACVSVAPCRRYERLRALPWPGSCGWAMAVFVVMCALPRRRIIKSPLGQAIGLEHFYTWPADIVVVIVCATLIVQLARALRQGGGAIPLGSLRCLTSGPALVLGWFSYSLYLLHSPMIVAVERLVPVATMAPTTGSLVYWGFSCLARWEWPGCSILGWSGRLRAWPPLRAAFRKPRRRLCTR
jgi:peptidoglycan/LPS O-acetylase OafA/YrhL